ncbi:MAG: HAD family hydrolase [Verrucomicrobiota bacterium]
MILVFDMDDTLYDEMTYVKSGMQAVARWLSTEHHQDEAKVYSELMAVLKREGRGSVFDTVLERHGLGTGTNVRRCVSVYRQHWPEIHISKAAEDCLNRFRDWPLYLVTDGHKLVQSRKIEALGLDRWFRKTMPTHRYGRRHAKPSTWCFHRILAREKGRPEDMVYVGDNPHKDFVNLKKEGFRTVRVRTGMFRNVRLSDTFEAEVEIRSLRALTETFLRRLF